MAALAIKISMEQIAALEAAAAAEEAAAAAAKAEAVAAAAAAAAAEAAAADAASGLKLDVCVGTQRDGRYVPILATARTRPTC